MGFCSAFNCSNRSTFNCGKSFFRFPLTNKKLTKIWVMKMKRGNFRPSKFSKLCSDHFTPDCIRPKIGFGKPALKPNAFPTIFNFSSSLKTKKGEEHKGIKTRSKPPLQKQVDELNKQEYLNYQPSDSLNQPTSKPANYLMDVKSLVSSPYKIENIKSEMEIKEEEIDDPYIIPSETLGQDSLRGVKSLVSSPYKIENIKSEIEIKEEEIDDPYVIPSETLGQDSLVSPEEVLMRQEFSPKFEVKQEEISDENTSEVLSSFIQEDERSQREIHIFVKPCHEAVVVISPQGVIEKLEEPQLVSPHSSITQMPCGDSFPTFSVQDPVSLYSKSDGEAFKEPSIYAEFQQYIKNMNGNEKLTTIAEGSDKGIPLASSPLTSKRPTHTLKSKAVAYLDTSGDDTFMAEGESNSSFDSSDNKQRNKKTKAMVVVKKMKILLENWQHC